MELLRSPARKRCGVGIDPSAISLRRNATALPVGHIGQLVGWGDHEATGAGSA
jgi:hypothetical protein